ncbi:MAG: hypothetical protein LBB51_05825 [Zoogloeaceae bacterium]|jgi:hypothetical protein|nr:hypothetical protein [Zoogloeaceae bacterium]
MIIWQGLGILVIALLVAAIPIANSLFNLPGMAEYEAQYKDAVTLFLAALLTLLFGLLLRLKKGKVLIDEATGKTVEIKPRHTLFFIPVLFWAVIFAGFGIHFLFSEPRVPDPEGALIRAQGNLCASEEEMTKAIAAISATEQPRNYDQLTGIADQLERVLLFNERKDCGVIDESALPARLTVSEMRAEEHAGHTWHIARVYFQEMGGEKLKLSQQIEPAWLFHLYANEEDAFLELHDGRKW